MVVVRRMMLQRASIWTKALFGASVLELPLLSMLVHYGRGFDRSALGLVIVWYHVIPLSLISFGWLSIFGHDNPTGDSRFLYVLVFLLVFMVQLIVTVPLAALGLRLSVHSKVHSTHK